MNLSTNDTKQSADKTDKPDKICPFSARAHNRRHKEKLIRIDEKRGDFTRLVRRYKAAENFKNA